MKKFFLAAVYLLSCSPFLFAQGSTEDFEISLPEQKIENSFYRTIQCIDSRFDTTNMGIVQLGLFNRKTLVRPVIPFCTQLTSVMNALIDSTAKEGELLLQVRQLNFAEITAATSEKGYFHLNAILYSNSNGFYQKINSIDTVILIKAMDVTRAMFRRGSKTLTGFLASSLLIEPTGREYYNLKDIASIDSLEKRKITVYNTSAYTDGLYLTYQSFMNQIPDKQINVEKKGEKISAVKTFDENGKSIKVKLKDIYAIVNEGKPFLATTYGYYPLQKINDDFLFTGKAKVTANTGNVMVASFFFGIFGALIASDADALFEIKIDHMTGGIIHLREIKQ
ncbi:MAG: hypothetical protein ABIN01_11485 [Ferruginibacter sp.]